MSRLELIADRDADNRVVLKSPAVGRWFRAPELGQLALAGHGLGVLDVLGRQHELIVPAGVRGVLLERPALDAADSYAVSYGQVLAVLGAELGAQSAPADSAEAAREEGALVFRSSSSGRFYLRPAPDKPAFVSEGEEISAGQTIFLLEVMKTFSRVAYGGDGLPERAKVVRILPKDGDDLEPGQAVLELEAL